MQSKWSVSRVLQHLSVCKLMCYFCLFTFFSLSAAEPERMASSIASLAMAGFMAVLELGCATVLGLPWGKTGGGGGCAIIGAGGGGGGGVKTGREVQVKEGEEGKYGGPALLSSSEVFLNFSSSSAASDFVCETQKSETLVTQTVSD